LRDAFDKFEAAGIKLYALSYDDQETLAEFVQKQGVPYTLLSDTDSKVIKQYGLLNEQLSKKDAFLYGIPYPGVFLCDEDGTVISKFFHDSYKKRESPEMLIDAALGHITIDETAPRAESSDDGIRITAALHGGNGSLRQGIVRQLVTTFELPGGLHIYGQPAPQGLTATDIKVEGPDGLVTLPMEAPPTTPLHLKTLDIDLNVWSGTVHFATPLYPVGELVSECRPIDEREVELSVHVTFQACTDETCLLPQTRTLTLQVELEEVDVPNLPIHTGHGQREGNYDSTPAMKRLIWRKVRNNPLRLLQFIWNRKRMERRSKRAS
jgi:hypothetical protein